MGERVLYRDDEQSAQDRKSQSNKLTPEDWCREGLLVLTERGHTRFTINAIAKRLGVTYGSFYSHFPSAEDYHSAVLQFWFRQLLVPFARRHLAVSRTSMETLLDDVEASGFTAMEVVIRDWAETYLPAAAIVRRADRYRMRAIAQMLRKTGLPPEAARVQGELMLISYLGLLKHPYPVRRRIVMKALAQMIDDLPKPAE